MMTRQLQMLHQADLRTDRNLAHWNRDEGCPVLEGYYTDTRNAGFAVSRMLLCLIHPESRHYDSERLADAVAETLRYLQKNRNADGCFDLASCNFDSAPDTAFTVNELTDACELLAASESRWRETLLPPLREIIERACEGICAGGFHTPNHRWAIAACLKQAALLTGREDFSRTADRYLREGLDINEDGEFAERSTGVYNAVNDEQMIRLYRATGNRLYLDAARRNLEMMLYYLEPDGSLFTMNSTRQDQGKRVFPVSYYKLYLLTGRGHRVCCLVPGDLGRVHGRGRSPGGTELADEDSGAGSFRRSGSPGTGKAGIFRESLARFRDRPLENRPDDRDRHGEAPLLPERTVRIRRRTGFPVRKRLRAAEL